MPTLRWSDKTAKQKRQAYAGVKAWRERNAERFKMESRLSIALRRSWQHAVAWPLICQHYGDRCLNCGAAEDLCFDHVIPLSKGGENQLTNGQPLCRKCNTFKGNLQEQDKDWRPDHGAWIVRLVEINPQLVLEAQGKRGWHRTAEGRREMERRWEQRGRELVVP